MVDQEIFARRLEALHGYLARLEAFCDADEKEFVQEPALHDLAEHYLHLAVEACLDLANHWISEEGLPTPDTNRDSFTVLEEANELDDDLAEALRGWAGFRNVLVHEDGEHPLGVPHFFKDFLSQQGAKDRGPLGGTRGAESSALAREGQ